MMDHREKPLAEVSERSASPAAPAEAPGSARLIVFLVVFIDLLGFGIVLPLLPLYASDLLMPLFPGDEHRALRGGMLGALMAAFSAMQFIFSPIWGRISDRVGRRPILILGLATSVVFYALFGVASEIGSGNPSLALVLLFVARLGAGMAGATIATAQAVIADCTPTEQRARGMALIGAAFGVGFTFGPLLGFASLFVHTAGAPGFLAAGLSLVALLLALVLLPETLRTGASAATHRGWLNRHGLREALRSPTIGILVLTFFLATFAFGGLESTLALLNRVLLNPSADPHIELSLEAARTTERKNFLVFAYVGAVLTVAQVMYRLLVRSGQEVRLMRTGVLLMILGLGSAVGVGILADPEYVISRPLILSGAALVMTVAVVGFAMLTPSIQALISRRSDPSKQGEILGVNQSASALARIFGPAVALPLFERTTSHVLPYAFSAILLVFVFLITLRVPPD